MTVHNSMMKTKFFGRVFNCFDRLNNGGKGGVMKILITIMMAVLGLYLVACYGGVHEVDIPVKAGNTGGLVCKMVDNDGDGLGAFELNAAECLKALCGPNGCTQPMTEYDCDDTIADDPAVCATVPTDGGTRRVTLADCAGNSTYSACAVCIHPGATERCDGVDNGCNGQIDEGFDTDGDGFTTCGTLTTACCALIDSGCVPGAGTDPRCADCNDTNATVRPGAGCGCLVNSDCNDGNQCTDDSCNAGNCVHTNNSAPCRASAGPCDTGEICAAGSCPADTFAPTTTVCRASAGNCDLAETCTGSSATCPSDTKSTAVCRTSTGLCDSAESCDGTNNACPTDTFAPATTVCRAAGGACDLAENCSGSSATCPIDLKSTAQCRASAGACDAAESCNGTSNDCPADAFAAATVECRAAATGGCDVAENCTGVSASCPADAFAPTTTVCRTSAGVCDPFENCTGSSAACPPDLKLTTQCRGAAGNCDVAENCDGVGNDCPANAFLPATTVCRTSTGTCDPAENCTGASASCPVDVPWTLGCCRGAAFDVDCGTAPNSVPAGFVLVGGGTCWHDLNVPSTGDSYGCITGNVCGVCYDPEVDCSCRTPDGGVTPDAGSPDTAPRTDAAPATDAAPRVDAGVPDATPRDASGQSVCSRFTMTLTVPDGGTASVQYWDPLGDPYYRSSIPTVGSGVQTSPFNQCAGAVVAGSFTSCHCGTDFGNMGCCTLPQSPLLYGCVHNQQPCGAPPLAPCDRACLP